MSTTTAAANGPMISATASAMQGLSASFASESTKEELHDRILHQQQSSSAGRSVLDYENLEELKLALEERMEYIGYPCEYPPSGGKHSDWLLPVPDEQAEPQTVENEIQRLWTLKSYLLLDADQEEAFEELTRKAKEAFGVPTSLISLVDLGRQFLFSGVEDGAPRETSRTSAFCSHTILSKTGICVVPDTLRDARFRENNLVTGGPKLRFYAGVPLISPEGYKLGTFCVEGPEPRPQGLTHEEQLLLKGFAKDAMDLMVQRRQRIQTAHKNANVLGNEDLRKHAAVTTNLGSDIYARYSHHCVVAMRLFQEAVQTLMHLEDSNNTKPGGGGPSMVVSTQRQEQMAQLLERFRTGTDDASVMQSLTKLLETDQIPMPPHVHYPNTVTANTIPGLFSSIDTLSRWRYHAPPALIFHEPFHVAMEPAVIEKSFFDDMSFLIPLEQASKATLFNMGLVHYHWGGADSAMQFFDLAASLSGIHEATSFDPVVLACLNNMAQIHLQYGRVHDAMAMLSDALTRGNAALTTIYGNDDDDDYDDDYLEQEEDHQDSGMKNEDGKRYRESARRPSGSKKREADARRTRRLRRKLARTLLNMGSVQFFKCDYDAAMGTCNDALMLLHTNMDEIEVAAIWYNIALLHYHKGNKLEALEKLEQFLQLAPHVLSSPASCTQCFDATCCNNNGTDKSSSSSNNGQPSSSSSSENIIETQQQALSLLRNGCSGNNHLQIAEALHRKGKIYFEMGNLYEAMTPLNEALRVRHAILGENHPTVAETLCLIGKVLQEREEYDVSLCFLKTIYLQTREVQLNCVISTIPVFSLR